MELREPITEEKAADLMDAIVERDARSKAGVARTDGFLTHEELLEQIRGKNPDKTRVD